MQELATVPAPAIYEQFGELAGINPIEQVCRLDAICVQPGAEGEYCDAMYAFAHDNSPLLSVTARAYALECCVQALLAEPAAASMPEYLRSFCRDVRASGYRQAEGHTFLQEDSPDRRFIKDVTAAEDSYDSVFVGIGAPPVRFFPRFAAGLASRMLHEQGLPDVGALGPIAAQSALSYVLSPRRSNPNLAGQPDVDLEFVKLGVSFGLSNYNEYGRAANLLRRGQSEQAALEHALVLNRLHESAAGLAAVFPPEAAPYVVAGARWRIRQSINTLAMEIQNGRPLSSLIDLKNGRRLGGTFEAGEPLQLLALLDVAFRKLRHNVSSPAARSVLCAEGDGFRQWRFIDMATNLPPSVSLYNRPEGDMTYNPQREYGRGGKGVEASIGYTIQLGDDAPIPLIRQEQRRDTISIRLDRESADDPTAEAGVISLDIGSVLGPPDAFGTKIAWLLSMGEEASAWLDEIAPGRGDLNHVRLAITQYGRADYFAGIAHGVDLLTQRRRITMSQLRRHYARAAGLPATKALPAS